MELAEWADWWKRRGASGLRQLLNEWDPIGVADAVDDEYDNYVLPLAGRLQEGGGIETVSRYLREVRTDKIGLDDWPEFDKHEERVARRIVAWFGEEMRR